MNENNKNPLTENENNEPAKRPSSKRIHTDLSEAYSYFDSKSTTPPPKKDKKKSWLGKIFLLAVIIFGVVMMVNLAESMSSGQKSLGEVLAQLDPLFGTLTIVALLLILLIDAAKYFIAISATTKKAHPLISLKVALLGRYYDNVTPFATGGQPMQIYYLCKKGFSGGLSAAVVFIKYAFNTCAWLFVAAIAMIFGGSALSMVSTGSFLKITGSAGV